MVAPGTGKIACGPDLIQHLVLGQTHSFRQIPDKRKHTGLTAETPNAWHGSPWDRDKDPHPGTGNKD
jgi:hypothetical protein